MKLYDSEGRVVTLTNRLGNPGGEGSVYEVQENKNLAAKVYHKNIDQKKAVKLSAKLPVMVRLKTDRLLNLVGWPVDTLHDTPRGRLVGFLMSKFGDCDVIHLLHGPKSRLTKFPDACWPFLVHAATNVARAFSVIHEHGHVIADVNDRNILVSKKATVLLIDCDSFQVTAQGQHYFCDVYTQTHTPPELQSDTSFRDALRTPNHDAFGLAVIIFQLLFMGRHPFAGAYTGVGEMPPEKAIKEFRFAYGAGALSRQMRQPPGTLPLEAVSQSVAQLFERAFLREAIRPAAQEWILALTELSKNLKQCNHNNGHYFLKALPSCPWCNLEAQTGIVLFLARGILHTQGTFNLTVIWAQIEAVPSPGPPQSLPEKSTLKMSASSKATRLQRVRLLWLSLSIGIVVIGTAAVILSNLSGGAAFWIILGIMVLSINIAKGPASPLRKEIENAKRETEKQWQIIHQRWENDTGAARFNAKLRELESKKLEYQNLPYIRQQKLKNLEANLRERQLYKFLDQFRIAYAGIRGIGPSRTATLQSYGIETAADVDWNRILGVPGFGPAYTEELVDWRVSIEKKFIFNPSKGIDPADLRAVDQEIAMTRSQIEKDLLNGPTQLHQIGFQIKSSQEVLRPKAEAALNALAQTEADWKIISKPILSTIALFITLGVTLTLSFFVKQEINKNRDHNLVLKKNAANANTAISPPTQPLAATSTAEQKLAQAKASFEEGITYTKAGLYQQAAQFYQQALILEPSLPEAHHELGYAFYRMEKYDESIAHSEQAIKLRPKNPDTYHNLALAQMALNRWDKALQSLEESISIRPAYAPAYYNLGLVYRKLLDNEAAVEAFQEAVRLKPDFAVAHYELALSYLAIEEREPAILEYEILSSLNPKLADRLYSIIYKEK